jgi:hypothetical protein
MRLAAKPNTGRRKQQKETAADEAQLLRRQSEIVHHRHRRETDDGLVGEIDQHEQEHHGDDDPCAPSSAYVEHVFSVDLIAGNAWRKSRASRRWPAIGALIQA